MDLQLIAIAAIVIIVVVILLACFVLGMRERTFEDALAEQKGLGILLGSGQHGKSGDRHKEKHKAHHDTGGGAKKKTQQKSTENVVATNVSQQRTQKKEKEEKEKVSRDTASTSGSADEKAEKETKRSSTTKETTPVGQGGSESSRSRQSSSGEAISNTLESSDSQGKKQRRQQQQLQEYEEPVREEAEDKASTDQKGTKKAPKKKRRADMDDVDSTSMRHSQNEEEQAGRQAESEDYDRRGGGDTNIGDEKSESVPSESMVETAQQQLSSKKAQKKKQKSAGGKQQQDDDQQQENKENVGVDEHVEKVTAVTTTSAAPAKQKAVKPAATKASSGEEHNLDVIIEQLKTSSLNHTQLEFVLNALLNKQELSGQGTQKVDQLAGLKKQLDEKEKALTQETQLAAGVNQKLKELRQQFDVEKNRYSTAERTYQEQLGGSQRDLQSARQKVQELTAQCSQLSVQSRQTQDQLMSYRKMLDTAPNPTQVQSLRDENQRLKEHLSRNEQETINAQRLRQELAQRESHLQQAEQRLHHLQQNLTMQDSNHAQQLVDLQQKLAAKDAATAQLEQELASVRREWSLLETSVRELRQQATVAAQAPTVERNVRLQNSQQVDNEEVEKLKKEISELKASKTSTVDLEKRVKDLDKELKESQTASKRQVDSSQKELRKVQDELESAQRERTKLQEEKTRLSTSSASNSEKIEKLEKAQADMRSQLESEKKARSSAESEIAKLKAERDSALKASEDAKKASSGTKAVQEETITLKQQVQQLQSSVTTKDKDADELRRRSSELEADLVKLKEDRHGLEIKIQALVQENNKLSEQAALASHNGHTDGASADALKIQEFSLTHLNKQLISKDGEIVQLKQQLDQQRSKNSELRERNQKVVEAMNQLEKTSKDVTQKMETKYQKQLEDQEKQTKLTLAKIIPDAKIPEKESFSEWIKEVQRVVIEKTKTVIVEKNIRTSDMEIQGQSKQLETLKRENADLQSKVRRYQLAFEQAESEFKSIEDRAADQEKSWRQRVSKLEEELSKVQASRSVDLTSTSTNETKEIELKFNSVYSSLESLKKENTTHKTEMERLRSDLETERVGNRDLSSQVVKLRGMLKTGQDALKQEQDLSAQLQKQLKAFQANASGSPNDAKEGKGEQQLHDELKELRTKLGQREQQLEREMMINKQLNNKLASLGVASPSASIGSSNGSL